MEGQSVRLLVRRDRLTESVAKILAEQEVLDLTVTDPPVEEVIGRVFRSGGAAIANTTQNGTIDES